MTTGFICSNSDREIGLEEWKSLLSPVGLSDELIACMNLSEMAKDNSVKSPGSRAWFSKAFRVPQIRQTTASLRGLFFDVFPSTSQTTFFWFNPKRSSRTATRGRRGSRSLRANTKSNFGPEPSGKAHPFSFPLWAESIRAQLSTESWGDRVRKMALKLEDSV